MMWVQVPLLSHKKKRLRKMNTPHYYLNYKCLECDTEYGNKPTKCHCCGCNSFKKIKPKYQSLAGRKG
jgi:hypothetical protein